MSDEYKRGYAAGYQSGLRHGRARTNNRHTYRRQPWRCNYCDAVGFVLIRDDDNEVMQRQRMVNSHAAQRRRTRCDTPRMIKLTQREYLRWKDATL